VTIDRDLFHIEIFDSAFREMQSSGYICYFYPCLSFLLQIRRRKKLEISLDQHFIGSSILVDV